MWLRGALPSVELTAHCSDIVVAPVDVGALRHERQTRIGHHMAAHLRTEAYPVYGRPRFEPAGDIDRAVDLLGRVFGHDLRTAILIRVGVHLDMGRPVHPGVELLGHQQLAGFAVHRIGEAVAVEVHERLVLGAVDIEVVTRDGRQRAAATVASGRRTTRSPLHAIDAPTFRKSYRWETSLAAWLRALSTSWRSILLTTSKDESAAMAVS